MDLSGIIFVGLALAWAGFLIPKALKHHDDVARTRSIDRFSSATRVLARREPVSKRDARLVVTGARPPAEPSPSPATSKATTSKVTTSKPAAAVARAQAQARRKAARVAA
ncbi:MAG: hypothetical protein HOQ22_10140, partial [Nocardioidaceae bacterium]|nr:hypothetical protein [Nocardioidaceae bacterium]